MGLPPHLPRWPFYDLQTFLPPLGSWRGQSMTLHRNASVLIRWPDGTSTEVPAGASAANALAGWNPEKARQAVAASFDGQPIDLTRPVVHAGVLAPLLPDDKAGREVIQHSAAHLIAKAVTELIPDAKPTDGPPTDEGFYYDFEMRPLTADELPKLEAKIRETVRRKDRFERSEISKTEAEALFRHNPHKLGYIAKVPDGEPVSIYRTGSFTDLCRGPHVPDAGWLEGIHILGFSAITSTKSAPGGDFQRIRGVAFPTRAELETYLKRRTEA